ncbi:site-specific integrase [Pantoea sp. GM_Pan_4]|uniref:site-specific integrase n=1 Tax=Pantoea sp. GM_Pan_4 TaxID=2937389 RepID=UPI00226B1C12|nr:site-specific integrase [Pantoea sp. GM_Pan_4]
MQVKKDRYLVLDLCGNYYVRITIPAYMRHLFEQKRYFVKSTGTSDIRQARLFRDAIAVEWARLREQVKPKEASKIEKAIEELKSASISAFEMPMQQFSSVQSGGVPTLLMMRDIYILKFSEKRKLTTLSKTNKAVEVLLLHLKKRDVKLKDVNRTTVTAWIDSLKEDKAAQTIQNYISSLAQIWDLARNRYHDAPQDNPWRGHALEAKSSKVSYQPFTVSELAKVFAALEGDEEMQAVTLIGMYSGMRLNEICSLKSESIKTIEGVLCFEIKEGKTKSAARIVPVHSQLKGLVIRLQQKPYDGFLLYRASITDRADGKRSTWHTQRFTRAKRKALGENGNEYKVFHSLRGMFISQLDREKIPEDRIALLAGHERGNTESFKTYSKNSASPAELSEYIEKVAFEIKSGDN